jgi:large subunit ribosomal protein L10
MVKEEKIKEVEEVKKMIDSYPIIGILDMFKLPSRPLQDVQKKLRGKILIKMTKKSLLMLAIKNSGKQKIKEIEKIIPQQPALIFTELEPFKFYSTVGKMKSLAAAKEGDVAPSDILVSAGPTSLLPGPAISELAKAGIPAGVEEGKIAVKRDTVVAKKGQVISKDLAGALRKLNIEPMEIGLNIVAIYDNGMIYSKEALSLVNVFPEKLKEGFNNALNLSISIGYPTKDNIKFLLSKAFNSAKALESKIGGTS